MKIREGVVINGHDYSGAVGIVVHTNSRNVVWVYFDLCSEMFSECEIDYCRKQGYGYDSYYFKESDLEYLDRTTRINELSDENLKRIENQFHILMEELEEDDIRIFEDTKSLVKWIYNNREDIFGTVNNVSIVDILAALIEDIDNHLHLISKRILKLEDNLFVFMKKVVQSCEG